MRLTSKYSPKRLNDFIGLEEPRKIIRKWLENPYPQSFLFVGDSGTGKTTMGEAIAQELGIDTGAPESHFSFIHIASQKCTVGAVSEIQDRLIYKPWAAFWVVLVDEADQMTAQAQVAFLSLLDHIPDNVVIIFTCNETERLESRFLSRCAVVKFSNYGLNGEGSRFLEKIWDAEYQAPVGKLFEDARPDFKRILKDARNNLRTGLMELEKQLMLS